MDAISNNEDPAITNQLYLAEVNYQNKNYYEAYYYYDKLSKIHATNHLAYLRYAICKTFLNTNIDYKLDDLKKIFNDVAFRLKTAKEYNNSIEKYVQETIEATDESLEATISYADSYSLTEASIGTIRNKLKSIYDLYDVLLLNTKDNKEHVTAKIIETLNELAKDRDYTTENIVDGSEMTKKYRVDYKEKKLYQTLTEEYQNKLYGSNQKQTNGNKKGITHTKKSNSNTSITLLKAVFKILKVIFLVVTDFYLIVILAVEAEDGMVICGLTTIAFFLVINSPSISHKLFKDSKIKKIIALVGLVVLWFMAFMIEAVAIK